MDDRVVVQHDHPSNTALSVTIATAVAEVVDEPVTELEPLHYTIDTDALERLFEPRANGHRASGTVSFSYQGCTVSVSAAGEVVVDTPSH